MASMQFDPAKQRYQIQVGCPDRKRRSIYLRVSKDDADKIKKHIERLALYAKGKVFLDDDDATLLWLRSKQGKGLAPRLEKLGLIQIARKPGRQGRDHDAGDVD